MPKPSQASIETLRAMGYSDTRIAQAVGRDSSLISQIRRGLKPGNNLAESLSALARTRTPATSGKPLKTLEPPRRTTRTGEAAKVRTPPSIVPRGTRKEIYYTSQTGRKTQIKQLREFAKNPGSHVFLTVTVKKILFEEDYSSDGVSGEDGELKNQPVDLFGKGGWNAAALLRRVDEAGGNAAAFNAVLLEQVQSLPFVQYAQGIGTVVMAVKA